MAYKAKFWDGSQWVDMSSSITDTSVFAPIDSPNFTGTVTLPQDTTIDGELSTVQSQIDSKSSSSSPSFSGDIDANSANLIKLPQRVIDQYGKINYFSMNKGDLQDNVVTNFLDITIPNSSLFHVDIEMIVGGTYTAYFDKWYVSGRIYQEGTTIFDTVSNVTRIHYLDHGSKQSSYWDINQGTLTASIPSRASGADGILRLNYQTDVTGNVPVTGGFHTNLKMWTSRDPSTISFTPK